MRIKIRKQAQGFLFTPYHRISPRFSFKQPKSSEIYLSFVTSLKWVKCTNILPVRKFLCCTWRNYGSKLGPHFPSVKITFHLPPLKLVAHLDILRDIHALYKGVEKVLTSLCICPHVFAFRGMDKSPLGQKPTRTKAHWTISYWTKAHCLIR